MVTLVGEVKAARQAVLAEALQRWERHARRRDADRKSIAAQGPGAADSEIQRKRYAEREARRKAIQQFSAAERMIGDAWEPTVFAPSERARQAAIPVARIVTLPGKGYEAQGVATGFLISPGLLMTNHHVFPDPSYALSMGANFLHQTDEKGKQLGIFFAVEPETFFLSDAVLDYAIVAVAARGTNGERLEDLGFVRLIEAAGKILKGRPVNIIQHPGGGARQYATTGNLLLDILDEGFLHYEADTAQGSSGSPVFNENWELVGLHHCGIPDSRDGQILRDDGNPWNAEGDPEDDIHWLANEGARVSHIVASLKMVRVESEAQQRMLTELLTSTADPLRNVQIESAAPDAAEMSSKGGVGMAQNIFNISGNVTINFAAPAAAAAVVPPEKPAPTPKPITALEKTQTFDPDYAERPGYDPDFLGVEVPLPGVTAARAEELYTVDDYRAYLAEDRNAIELDTHNLGGTDPLELRYHHFSLVTNKKYRMPMWTAVNVDYRAEAREDPRSRQDFGGENWRLDGRVPKKFQLVDADIYGPAGNFDRGHIVRRDDNCWGESGLPTAYANADTYHWTNCTPQHELFNQETPDGKEYRGRIGIWGAFEGRLADQIEAGGGQAVIFAGPVLGTDGRTHDFGRGRVWYPLKFWKVVIVPETTRRRPRLLAYGFVFNQSAVIKEFGLDIKEGLDLTGFGRQAKSIKAIGELAGIEFPDVVIAADQAP
ncbi:endonuclease [Solimonas sp. K1W22B-7]|uniref:DNA/RNA non-specific endonuclease n=1 Tax=Solimonas sp. K1W22B-7 TaxID=2303331 RepID=UPI000E32E917|nr:DNA/RNA non-specific endonuclease [Solimonas sp. K1W22B-7]AXQ27865.1 endonuclease [Solimonas sp. K1W22B-7]